MYIIDKKTRSKSSFLRLDKFISLHLDISRQKAVKLITNNQVYINKILNNKTDSLINMDAETMNVVILPLSKKDKPPISYIEINDNFIVVNKPYGISSARSENTPENEYVLNELVKEEYILSESLRPGEFGLVHRLDKTTEGLMILARNREYYNKLLELFEKQTVTKTYLAIVEIKNKNLALEGRIILPLFYGQDKVLVQQSERSRESITSYKVIKTYDISNKKFGVVEIQPHTGRRHQIRVVLGYLGMPIVGDNLYGGMDFERVCLYASTLEIDSLGISHSLYKKHLHDINNFLMHLY